MSYPLQTLVLSCVCMCVYVLAFVCVYIYCIYRWKFLMVLSVMFRRVAFIDGAATAVSAVPLALKPCRTALIRAGHWCYSAAAESSIKATPL